MTWPILYIFDSIGMGIFCISYYLNCYRKGYRIDLWHMQLFLVCILPNFIMLPFSRNELNILVLGGNYGAVVQAIPFIFLVTFLGFLSTLAGGLLWSLKIGLGIRRAIREAMNIVPRSSEMLMSSRHLLLLQSMLCMLLQFAILAFYFKQEGFGFDLRSFTFENPTFRPLALFISNYSVVIASHCLARYVDTKELSLLVCCLLLTLGLIFFGSRGSLLGVGLNIFLCYLVGRRRNISLLRIGTIFTAIVAFGFYLGNVRAGQYSLSDFFAAVVFLLFFGNNFSDLRDFAWVYSSWDHVYWHGKTYLAALMAFVPRFASDFRDTWGIGAATAATAGFDPHSHPGLRPGSFGEGYLNFGLAGVVFIGLILGAIFRRVDIDVKEAMASPHPSMIRAFASTMFLGIASSLAVTSGFSGIYVLVGIYLFSWMCLQVLMLLDLQ